MTLPGVSKDITILYISQSHIMKFDDSYAKYSLSSDSLAAFLTPVVPPVRPSPPPPPPATVPVSVGPC